MKIPSYDERPGDKAFSGLGKKLLRKMGWSEGDGLGLGKDGIRNAIEIKKKDDLKGVGKTSERYNWEEKWWEGHFKKAADKFKAVVDLSAKDAVDGDDSDDGDDSETDEFEKNVRETMRDTTTATASATATKEKNVNGNDGVKYNGCAKELKVAREIAKEQGFRGRKGKLARVASFEEEQMKKYGIQTGTLDVRTTNNNTKDSKAVAAAVVVTVEDEKSVNDGNNKKSSDKKKGESYEGKQSKTTKKSSWWRNAGFLWGGLVGSKRELDRDVIRKDDEDEDVDKNAKNGFTEKQQENIFKKAHEMASAKGSRRGLGDTAVNFTGKEFTGTKKAFDENDDDNDEKKKKKKKKERRLEKKEKLSSDDGDDKNDKKSKKKSKRKSRDEEDDINDDKKSKKKKSKKK